MSVSMIVSIALSLPTEGPPLYWFLVNENLFVSATILFVSAFLTVVGTLLSDVAVLDTRIKYAK